jgi:acyl transferase domain-containing protein
MLGNHLPTARRLPISIVGASCRLPGASNVQAFWEVLAGGRDTVTELPAARRDALSGAFGDHGGFLEQIDAFDAGFFEMSPHEAIRLDPHHRLLLETVWEAVEDAGLTMDDLAGSRTGVYTSCFASHYWNMLRGAGMDDIHAIMGAHRWTAPAGRISRLLDLRGPSIGTESTCASSLVAAHLACTAIRAGEIDMAIVAASNLILNDRDRVGFADAGLVSSTGRCRFGDADADGYVPAEGVITLILRPMRDAVESGDRVYATIIGSCVNSNGRQSASAGATGTTGQEDMLRMSFEDAGIKPGDIDYIEAHGPGTALGDEVELTALSRVLREGRADGERCLLGSVKSNIGHTEATAGLAGLLKTALALRHKTIPATLHVRRRSPVLRGDGAPIELAHTTQPWPYRGRPAIAGVTALGMFGVGAHMVLTEAPAIEAEPRPAGSASALLLPLSTSDPQALGELATRYANTLSGDVDPLDVCFSAGTRRTHFPHRLAVVGQDRQSLVEGLRRIADGELPVDGDRVSVPPRVVFVFSGQGSQWLGMGRELLAGNPVFAKKFGECDRAVAEERDWSLIDRLHEDRPLEGEWEIQPALWAMQVSLAEVWRHWGIKPDVVIGHSMGEIAAATTAGALTLRDAAALVCRRSELLGTLDDPGAMVAVQLGENEARQAIGEYGDRVHIAVTSSRYATVLAGDPHALAAVIEPLRERGVFCRPIRANLASHTPYVEPLREPLLAALADLTPRASKVAMRSTALNRIVRGEELDAGYWMANLRNPVRFDAAVRAELREPGPSLFLEVSPHPLLVAAIEDGIEECAADSAALPSTLRERPEREALLTTLAAAHCRGCTPEWARLYEGGRFVPLPSYPWQRKRYWVSAAPEVVESPAPAQTAPVRVCAVVPDPEPVAKLRAAPQASTVVSSSATMTEHIARRAAEVLAATPDSIDPARSLTVSGMDSLLAAKLRTKLKQDLNLLVSVGELLGERPLTELASQLHARVNGGRPSEVLAS